MAALETPMIATGRRRFLRAAASAVGGAASISLLSCATRPRDVDVIVIGAGLAGLTAALGLEARGLSVIVLEAADRVGGRIRTLDDVPGAPETGGTQIGAAYVETLALATRLGLTMEPNARSPLLRDEAMVMHVRGERMSLAAWATSPLNPLPAEWKRLTPDRAMSRLLGANPIKTLEDWRSPALREFDVPLDAALRARGVSDAALSLLDVNNSLGNTLAQTSLLNFYYSQANVAEMIKVPGATQNVRGGNQRLPDAMARALRGPLLLRSRVLAVERDARGVNVQTADGKTMRARFAICTLPLPAMREIKFLPALRAPHIEAINEAAYARITQLHVEVKSRFWENTKSGSGEVHSPFLWSDTALERIFPQDRLADARPPTLTVWINGAGCASWDALSEEATNARVNAELEKIYPGARGAVRLAKKVSWHQEPFAGGAWINWAPGQITRFASALGQPEGRLFFAGEHTGTHFRGIEAAVSSGARAAKEIFATL